MCLRCVLRKLSHVNGLKESALVATWPLSLAGHVDPITWKRVHHIEECTSRTFTCINSRSCIAVILDKNQEVKLPNSLCSHRLQEETRHQLDIFRLSKLIGAKGAWRHQRLCGEHVKLEGDGSKLPHKQCLPLGLSALELVCGSYPGVLNDQLNKTTDCIN